MQCLIKLVAANQNIGQSRIRGIMLPASQRKFLFIKSGEIVASGVLHGVMILKISLQNHFAGRLASPGASGNLGEQLEGTLGGAEVRKSERAVGADHTDQGYAMNVMAF